MLTDLRRLEDDRSKDLDSHQKLIGVISRIDKICAT